MRIAALFDKQKRNRYRSKITKKAKRLLAKPVETTPVFVFGKQRSGTNMLMNVFDLHPDTEIFNEYNNKAFLNSRIRSFETLGELVRKSKATFVCFKPISDSHLIREFAAHFLQKRFVWIYRDYRDAANSSLRMFQNATRAIRIVCENRKGGGWFQEGVSKETASILRNLYSPHLSEFDFACLVWWARNRIVIEQNLVSLPDLVIVRYEDLVTRIKEVFAGLFSFIGMRYHEKALRYVHRMSISKDSYPEITPVVQQLCKNLMLELNNLVAETAKRCHRE